MGVIVKLAENKYIDWSGVCDAPKTWVMDKESMEDLVRNLEEHSLGYKALENASPEVRGLMLELIQKKASERLKRIEENGTSSMLGEKSAREFLRGNRAGPKERELTLEQIIEAYTWTPEKKDKWPFT